MTMLSKIEDVQELMEFDRETLGNAILDVINDSENYPQEIAKSLEGMVNSALQEEGIDKIRTVENTFIAITGTAFDTLLRKIKEDEARAECNAQIDAEVEAMLAKFGVSTEVD